MRRARGLLRAGAAAAAALLLAAAGAAAAGNVTRARAGGGGNGTAAAAAGGWGRAATAVPGFRAVPRGAFAVPARGGVLFAGRVAGVGGVAAELAVPAAARTGSSQPVLFAHAARAGARAPALPAAAPLDSASRAVWAYDRPSFMSRRPRQTVALRDARAGDAVFLAVYAANMSGSLWPMRGGPPPPPRVRLRLFACAPARCNQGRAPLPVEWTGSVAVLALPVVLGTAALLTIAACARGCSRVARRAARAQTAAARPPPPLPGAPPAPARDRLAPAETDAMFPRFAFEKAHAAALGAAGEPSCVVCLSGYEEGEFLRRLPCGHSYHAMCLDRWLGTNASCPRCRKPARIRVPVGSRLVALRVALVRYLRARYFDDRTFPPPPPPAPPAGDNVPLV